MDTYLIIGSCVTAFATLGLAFLTAVYVVFTNRMLKEMQKARDPVIDIDFEVKSSGLHEVFIWVLNPGQSPATNIRFKVEENLPLGDLYELKETRLKDEILFKSGISYLAPGRKRRYVVGNLRLNPDVWGRERYIVRLSISCENHRSETLHFTPTIDVLQCIEPVVYRGEECATPGARYQVKMED